jgi:peptidoglycan-associated lipoprotein
MRKSFLVLCSLMLALACAHQGSPATSSTAHPTLAEGETTPCGNAQVFFSAGSTELDASARERLDLYAGCLSRHETDVIYVAGMTDPEGGADDNVTLGRRRAFAVAEHLHTQGVQVEFVIRSLGEDGAMAGEPLWPLERSASVTGVATE